MIKLLIGGSPCTHWSIAQRCEKRETKAEGLGWELFKNFLIAKEKFQPDFFLYENNKSAASEIKKQIALELGVGRNVQTRFTYINSALVSAQNRQRFYVTNFGDIEPPKDRGILLKDILEENEIAEVIGTVGKNKASCLVAHYGKGTLMNLTSNIKSEKKRNKNPQPPPPPLGSLPSYNENEISFEKCNKVGVFPNNASEQKDGQGTRIYSHVAKSVTLSANGGGGGAKTGLYAIKARDNTSFNVYEVRDEKISIKGKEYPIKLSNGFYTIRKLTPTECERLQTLPDGYTEGVSNSQRYKALGNGWTAEVIIHLLKQGLKNVERNEKLVVLSMYDGIATGRYCLEKLGFKDIKYYAFEVDKFAKKIALRNYPDIIQLGDAFEVRSESWILPNE